MPIGSYVLEAAGLQSTTLCQGDACRNGHVLVSSSWGECKSLLDHHWILWRPMSITTHTPVYSVYHSLLRRILWRTVSITTHTPVFSVHHSLLCNVRGSQCKPRQLSWQYWARVNVSRGGWVCVCQQLTAVICVSQEGGQWWAVSEPVSALQCGRDRERKHASYRWSGSCLAGRLSSAARGWTSAAAETCSSLSASDPHHFVVVVVVAEAHTTHTMTTTLSFPSPPPPLSSCPSLPLSSDGS